MEEDLNKKGNINLTNFDPTFLNNDQEMIFTLKDTNVLDEDDKNNMNNNINNINGYLQINDIKFKDTGISIERYNENELLEPKNEKYDLELQDKDGQAIDENTLLNKFKNIKNKIEKKNQIVSTKKKFQEEFYNEEEIKLLNKKKNRKKKGSSMVVFDIDLNEEENKEENNKDNNNINNEVKKNKENNTNDDNNKVINNNKKKLFTSEEKERLENLFNNNKKNKDIKEKKNIINIDENLLEDENNDNNDNNDNIRINNDKNYKVLDDYAIFLDNLPNPKKKEDSNKNEEIINNDINNKENIEKKEINNNNSENNNEKEDKEGKEKNEKDDKEKKEEKEEEEEEMEDEFTFKKDDDIPLISDEPIIGKGVCVALQIFKNKKMLKKEEEFGRYHDKRYENITNGVNDENGNEYDNNTLNVKDKDEYYKHKEINIEYRDENGKKLRPKEMARYQALIFHGAQSSVRKREKKLLREKYQVFVQNPNNNKTLNYMNFMKDKNHQAFATLQGKSSFL